jgi:hypothetical protein
MASPECRAADAVGLKNLARGPKPSRTGVRPSRSFTSSGACEILARPARSITSCSACARFTRSARATPPKPCCGSAQHSRSVPEQAPAAQLLSAFCAGNIGVRPESGRCRAPPAGLCAGRRSEARLDHTGPRGHADPYRREGCRSTSEHIATATRRAVPGRPGIATPRLTASKRDPEGLFRNLCSPPTLEIADSHAPACDPRFSLESKGLL